MDDEIGTRLRALEERLKEFEDRQAIHDALMRYCRGVDRADGNLIASAFHPDAIADHGMIVFTGENIGPALTKIENAVAGNMHFVGNELIEIEGDVAFAEFYFISFSEIERQGETLMIWRGARYVDRWEKRDGVWKISYRIVPGGWNRVDPVLERIPNAHKLHKSFHSHEDAVYRIRNAQVGELGRERDVDDKDAASTFLRSLTDVGMEPVRPQSTK